MIEVAIPGPGGNGRAGAARRLVWITTMGYSSELVFDAIELSPKSLREFRNAAVNAASDPDCPFGYILDFILVDCDDGRSIDLHLPGRTPLELRKLRGGTAVPWEECREGGPPDDDRGGEEPRYTLDWNPYEGVHMEWMGVDEFAAWLSAFCLGGRLYQLMLLDEGAGKGIWGWEFLDGKFRDLEMAPRGRWKKPRGLGRDPASP